MTYAAKQKFVILSSIFLSLSCKAMHPNSDLQNINLADPNRAIEDQLWFGTCFSFGIMGLLESDLYQRLGITFNLSELYYQRSAMIYSGSYNNIFDTFDILDAKGVIPESLFPYSTILNRTKLEDKNIAAIEKLVKSATPEDREGLFKRDEYYGLARGEKESPNFVGLPAQARRIADLERVPSYSLPDKTRDRPTPCFTTNPAVMPQRWVSPQNFLKQCFGFSKDHFKVLAPEQMDEKTFVDTMAQLINGYPVMLGIRWPELQTSFLSTVGQNAYRETGKAPDPAKTQEFHAVLITGYLDQYALNDVNAHRKGLLATDTFEKFALLWDLNLSNVRVRLGDDERYRAVLDVVSKLEKSDQYPFVVMQDQEKGTYYATLRGVPNWRVKEIEAYSDRESNQARKDRRLRTDLGKLILREGGVLIVRNSWGAQAENGVDGSFLIGLRFAQENSVGFLSRRMPRDIAFAEGQKAGQVCFNKARPFLSFSSRKDQCIDCCDGLVKQSYTTDFKNGCNAQCKAAAEKKP